MVLLLGSIVTLVVAFTRDNVRRPREPDSGDGNVKGSKRLHTSPPLKPRLLEPGWDRSQAAERSSG